MTTAASDQSARRPSLTSNASNHDDRRQSFVHGLAVPVWLTNKKVSEKRLSTYTDADCQPLMPAHLLKEIDGYPCRQQLTLVVFSNHFKYFIGCCICLTMVLIWMETDNRAHGHVPEWMTYANLLLAIVYTVEIILRIFVERTHFFERAWNCFDFSLVVTDIGVMLITPFLPSKGSYTWIRVFRVIRACRIARVLRLVLVFRELYIIVHGMVSIGKALFWATGLMMLVLSMCSIIAVELLHPLMHDLVQSGAFDHCNRCAHSFDSIWNANLLWIQSLVAGDSWGATALPFIDNHAWTAIIFLAVLVISQLGLLNLIMTVMLDTAMEGRANDQERILAEKDKEMLKAFNHLTSICAELDEDKSGELTLEEMLKGYKVNKEFRGALKMMGIDSEDLTTVFQLMDQDGSGHVSYVEFIEQLHKMKSSDSHTLLIFIKHHVQELGKILFDLTREMQQDISDLRDNLGEHNKLISKAAAISTIADVPQSGPAPDKPSEDNANSEFHADGSTLIQNLGVSVSSVVERGDLSLMEPLSDKLIPSAVLESQEDRLGRRQSDSTVSTAGGEDLARMRPNPDKLPAEGMNAAAFHPDKLPEKGADVESQVLSKPTSRTSCSDDMHAAPLCSEKLPEKGMDGESQVLSKPISHMYCSDALDTAAILPSIQALLQWHAENMLQLLKEQTAGVVVECKDSMKKCEQVQVDDCSHKDTLRPLEQHVHSHLATLDLIGKDIDIDLDNLHQHVQDLMAGMKEAANKLGTDVIGQSSMENVPREAANKSGADVTSQRSLENVPLAIQPQSKRRVSGSQHSADDVWSAKAITCCAAPPPPPEVKGILH